MENVRKNRDIKLITTKARRDYLVLEPTLQNFSQKMCWLYKFKKIKYT